MYLVPSVLKFLLLLVILFRSLLITLSLSPDSQNSIKESVNTLPATTLPDLNFPPPPEEDPERVQDSLPKSSTEKIERKRLQARIRYHKMVERKKSDGTFAAWKEAKLKSLKDYKDSMPIDKKAIYTQKQVQRQRKRVAELLHVFAVKTKKNYLPKSLDKPSHDIQVSTQSNTEKKDLIPDLNYSPPPEDNNNKDEKKKSRYAIYKEKKIKEGKWKEFQEKEHQRGKRFRESLPEEERLARTRKYQKKVDEKIASSTQIHERRKEVLRGAAYRFHQRKRAKQLGLEIKPEHAIMKGGKKDPPL